MRIRFSFVASFSLLVVSVACGPGQSRCDRGADCASDGSLDGASDASDAATDADAQTGAQCGGFLGLACEASAFCDYPPESECGSGDLLGTCRTMPTTCTGEVAPVCGCDQQTYSNACAAAAAGVSVQHVHACDCVPPPCAQPPQGCHYEGASRCECGTLVCEDGGP